MADSLQSQIHTQGQNFQHYLKDPNESTIFLKPATNLEILNTIVLHIKKRVLAPTVFLMIYSILLRTL